MCGKRHFGELFFSSRCGLGKTKQQSTRKAESIRLVPSFPLLTAAARTAFLNATIGCGFLPAFVFTVVGEYMAA
jgi:hypothetical protein